MTKPEDINTPATWLKWAYSQPIDSTIVRATTKAARSTIVRAMILVAFNDCGKSSTPTIQQLSDLTNHRIFEGSISCLLKSGAIEEINGKVKRYRATDKGLEEAAEIVASLEKLIAKALRPRYAANE